MGTLQDFLQQNRNVLAQPSGTIGQLSIEDILVARTEDERNKPGLLTGRNVTNDTVVLLKEEGFFVIKIEDTPHHNFTKTKITALARKHGLIFVRRDYGQLSPENRQSALLSLRMLHDRQSSFPTIEEIMRQSGQNEKNKIRILADANIWRGTVEHLRARGWFVVHVLDTKQYSAPDTELARIAKENGLIIVTHDKGFLDPRQHVLSSLPGTIVLPIPTDNHGIHPHKRHLLKTALDDFMEIAASSVSEWQGTSIAYEADGMVTVSSPPYRPNVMGIKRPKTVKAQYWPSAAFVI